MYTGFQFSVLQFVSVLFVCLWVTYRSSFAYLSSDQPFIRLTYLLISPESFAPPSLSSRWFCVVFFLVWFSLWPSVPPSVLRLFVCLPSFFSSCTWSLYYLCLSFLLPWLCFRFLLWTIRLFVSVIFFLSLSLVGFNLIFVFPLILSMFSFPYSNLCLIRLEFFLSTSSVFSLNSTSPLSLIAYTFSHLLFLSVSSPPFSHWLSLTLLLPLFVFLPSVSAFVFASSLCTFPSFLPCSTYSRAVVVVCSWLRMYSLLQTSHFYRLLFIEEAGKAVDDNTFYYLS